MPFVNSNNIRASLSPSFAGAPFSLDAFALPLLIPRFLAGRLYVQLTPKSKQFWQREASSVLGLHLILRLWQKSQALDILRSFRGFDIVSGCWLFRGGGRGGNET
jgi:hypothetical protein